MLYLLFIIHICLSNVAALPSARGPSLSLPQLADRAADTCGDPTLARTLFEAYVSPPPNAHAIDLLEEYAHADTVGHTGWEIVGPAFRAWTDPGQINTIPLWFLFNPTTVDYLYVAFNSSTPPSRSGFVSHGILAYVYSTQICGSVPLYSVFQPNLDHYYTTDLVEHDNFVGKLGWSDGGIVAYVLQFDDFSQLVA